MAYRFRLPQGHQKPVLSKLNAIGNPLPVIQVYRVVDDSFKLYPDSRADRVEHCAAHGVDYLPVMHHLHDVWVLNKAYDARAAGESPPPGERPPPLLMPPRLPRLPLPSLPPLMRPWFRPSAPPPAPEPPSAPQQEDPSPGRRRRRGGRRSGRRDHGRAWEEQDT